MFKKIIFPGLICWVVAVNVQAQTLTVYPGDASGNGVVNGIDFLYLGLGYNYLGPERDTNILTFTPQLAQPWNTSFNNGLNMAHADCNGDGIINYYYDAFPVYVNYGLNRPFPAVVADSFPVGIPGTDPSLFFDPAGIPSTLNSGQAFSVPLVLGTQALPMQDLYGLVFSITVDPDIIDIDALHFNFNQNSWANPDNDRIFMQRKVGDNRIDVAWVRTDHNQRSGFGAIAEAEIIIIIDVVGYQSTPVTIDSIKVLNKFGQESTVAGSTIWLEINPDASTTVQTSPANIPLSIYPNPATDYLNIRHDSPIRLLKLSDMTGRILLQTAPDAILTGIQLPKTTPGMYLLEIQSEAGVFVRKIQIRS